MKKLFFILISATLIFTGCKKSDPDVVVYNPATDGIVGEWYSSGTNVAPLLVAFKIDSIYAKFEANNTYLVESFDKAKAKVTYKGTYVQSKSSKPGIWNIVLNQTTPTSITSKGIFEITGTSPKYTMKYEVMLDNGQNTIPTAEKGFGIDPTYKAMNVQNFIKIVK